MARGRRPVAQTALLIVAPLVLLAYAGVGGWLWWADQQDPKPPVAEAADAPPTPAEPTTGPVKAEDDPQPIPEDATPDKPEAEKPAEPAEAASPAETADTAPAQTGSESQDQGEAQPEGETDQQKAAADVTTPEPQAASEEELPDGNAGQDSEPSGVEDESKAVSEQEQEPAQPAAPVQHDQTAAKPAYNPEPLPASSPLKPAPDPALTIRGRYGPLPQRADDGREAWQVYARPFNRRADSRVIALVITELGLAEQPTLSAIQDLPGEVTLAFTPYSRRLEEWVPQARAAGHEVLLQVPMEPRNMEFSDPGDKALLTTNDPEVNLDRLEWVMSRATGYVGLTTFMGSRMTVSERDLRPVLDAMAARGLAFVDPKKTPASIADKLARELGMPATAGDREIDLQAAREPIDRRLGQLEQIALSRGFAVGFAQAYPVTIERLRKWIPEMKRRGFELAPVSAVVSR